MAKKPIGNIKHFTTKKIKEILNDPYARGSDYKNQGGIDYHDYIEELQQELWNRQNKENEEYMKKSARAEEEKYQEELAALDISFIDIDKLRKDLKKDVAEHKFEHHLIHSKLSDPELVVEFVKAHGMKELEKNYFKNEDHEEQEESEEEYEEEYCPEFLDWTTSYEEEEEELRNLIEAKPADVKLLKQEYESLTGKKYRAKKEKNDEDKPKKSKKSKKPNLKLVKENPSWVKDHNIWEEAKKKSLREYGEIRYPFVTYLYEKMGGKIKKKK